MNHVDLNPFSKMNVKLATQVLSQSVSNILFKYYPGETHGTAEFCAKMNKFFDCTNVRNQSEWIKTRNETVAPYRATDDPRFDWLENVFLGYLKEWSESIEKRKGKFTLNPIPGGW